MALEAAAESAASESRSSDRIARLYWLEPMIEVATPKGRVASAGDCE